MKKISNIKGKWITKFYAYIRMPLTFLNAIIIALISITPQNLSVFNFVILTLYSFLIVLFLINFFKLKEKTILFGRLIYIAELFISFYEYYVSNNVVLLIATIVVTNFFYYFVIYKNKLIFTDFDEAVKQNIVKLIDYGDTQIKEEESNPQSMLQNKKVKAKKYKLLIIAAVLFIVIFAIVLINGDERKLKTTVCTTNYEGVNVKNTLVSEGDKLTSIKYENQITVDSTLIPYLQSAVEEYAKQLENVKGVTYKYTISDTSVTESTEIDYTTADLSSLVKLGIVEEVDGKVPTYIGLEPTLNNMKELGCTCTEQ